MSEFEGFQRPTTTPVPDELFDDLMADLSEAELKVVLYIIRRTWGFKKAVDAIDLDQLEHGIMKKDGQRLDRGTGLSRRASLTPSRAWCRKKSSSNDGAAQPPPSTPCASKVIILHL